MLQNGQIRIIDHQDALYGPITYDLSSLLKDAYLELTGEQKDELINYFYQNSSYKLPDIATFRDDLEIMGLQRHLKILGIFARLSIRDGKTDYLQSIPLVKKYILETINKYQWLKPLTPIINV